MKITHTEEPKEFEPFSITIIFESDQEAINLLHYFNVANMNTVKEAITKRTTKEWPEYKEVSIYNTFVQFKNLLKSKGIIK